LLSSSIIFLRTWGGVVERHYTDIAIGIAGDGARDLLSVCDDGLLDAGLRQPWVMPGAAMPNTSALAALPMRT
jgi:hypothetical protein